MCLKNASVLPREGSVGAQNHCAEAKRACSRDSKGAAVNSEVR